MVCVCACLLSKLETGLELTSSSDPSPFVLAVISTGVGRGSTLPIGPVWGYGESPFNKLAENRGTSS